MSNPLDRHLETLRNVEPTPAAIDRAVASLRKPHHSPRLVPLSVGVAAIAAVLLWPRPGSGLAWAQIADQELPLRYHETRTLIAGGKSRTLDEMWLDVTQDASRSRISIFKRFTESGRSLASNPIDRVFEYVNSPKGVYDRQNELAYFSRKPRKKSEFDPRLPENLRGRTGLGRLLDDKKIHQVKVEREVMTRVGKADRYELERPRDTTNDDPKLNLPKTMRFTVYVQPGTKRILGYDSPEPSGDLWQTTIEYPDRFPEGTFAIPLRNGLRAYDLDDLNAKVEARLKTPIATLWAGSTNSTLRLVAQDDRKNLWAFWTGGRPNGDLKQKVRVLGVNNGAAWTSLSFVSKNLGVGHPRLGGMAVRLSKTVDSVDLQIPVFEPGNGRSKFVGNATVRKVPVLHLPFVEGLESVRRP